MKELLETFKAGLRGDPHPRHVKEFVSLWKSTDKQYLIIEYISEDQEEAEKKAEELSKIYGVRLEAVPGGFFIVNQNQSAQKMADCLLNED
jgi:hypothetical protein